MNTHIGSAPRLRELGYRPRSGWWQRKTGRFGRKIKPTPPMKILQPKQEFPYAKLKLTQELWQN